MCSLGTMLSNWSLSLKEAPEEGMDGCLWEVKTSHPSERLHGSDQLHHSSLSKAAVSLLIKEHLSW